MLNPASTLPGCRFCLAADSYWLQILTGCRFLTGDNEESPESSTGRFREERRKPAAFGEGHWLRRRSPSVAGGFRFVQNPSSLALASVTSVASQAGVLPCLKWPIVRLSRFFSLRSPDRVVSLLPAGRSDTGSLLSHRRLPAGRPNVPAGRPTIPAVVPTSPPRQENRPAVTRRLYDRSFAFAFFSQIGFVLANTLMAHYARWVTFLGGDVEQVGYIMGAGSVVGLFLRPWIGQCIDRVGARNMWLFGYLVFGIGAGANLTLPGIGPGIYVCRSLIILGAAFVFSSSLAFITHHAAIERRTEAIGILGVAGFTGMILGPALGDVILGEERTAEAFQTLFVVTVGALVIPSILLLFVKNYSPPRQSSRVRPGHFFRTVTECWPGMIALVVVTFGLCMTIPFVFLAKFIDEIGLSIPGVSEMGLFFLCYAGWGLTVRIASRRIPDRLGRRKMLLTGCLVMGTGMMVFPWVDAAHPWRLALPALLCGTGHALMFHTATSLFLHTFAPEVRGIGSALSLMMIDLGTICGAPVLGWLAFHFGYDWLFRAVGCCCLGSGIAYTISSIPVWKARLKAAGEHS